MMKALKYATIWAGVLLLSVTSCSGKASDNTPKKQNKVESAQNAASKSGKILIVFFSHAGENYSVGNVKVGNTKLVADEIARLTGGDEFEIVPEKNYNLPYNELTKVAKTEQETDERPAFKGELKNLDQYGTIYVGGPIWWGTFPQVMFTFFDKYNLNGKTIIPFTTHEGSGMGNVVADLKAVYPKANVKKGFSMYGHEVRSSLKRVAALLKSDQ